MGQTQLQKPLINAKGLFTMLVVQLVVKPSINYWYESNTWFNLTKITLACICLIFLNFSALKGCLHKLELDSTLKENQLNLHSSASTCNLHYSSL